MILHFRGSAQRIPRYSIADIVDHRVPSAALADKIVVAGVTAPALGDRFATWLAPCFRVSRFRQMQSTTSQPGTSSITR